MCDKHSFIHLQTTPTCFPFVLPLIFFLCSPCLYCARPFSFSLFCFFSHASAEEGGLQPWLRRNNCCCSRCLLLKSLKFVLPLLKREGCCWKYRGVADAGGCCFRRGGKERRVPSVAAGGLHLLPVAGAIDDVAANIDCNQR